MTEPSSAVAAPTLEECNDAMDFGQGVGSVGPWRVASCRWCHALVLYHSWKAHKHWHHMNAKGRFPAEARDV